MFWTFLAGCSLMFGGPELVVVYPEGYSGPVWVESSVPGAPPMKDLGGGSYEVLLGPDGYVATSTDLSAPSYSVMVAYEVDAKGNRRKLGPDEVDFGNSLSTSEGATERHFTYGVKPPGTMPDTSQPPPRPPGL